jgi:glucosamine--fructose-6-phosphate aminotransferase (isomerizing)
VTEGDQTIKSLSDHSIEIPESDEIFTPLFATIPLQLLSYYIAIIRGCNVDQPRNLAKSVTVE